MSAIEIVSKFETRSLNKAFAELEAELTAVVRGISVKLWDSILFRTPQYAGGMAASWSYSLGAPQFYDRSNMVDPLSIDASEVKGRWQTITPRRRGDLAAINIAIEDNIGSELPFKLGDTIYIANGVDHGEGPYSGDVESGAVPLRAVNLPGMPVKRSVDRIGSLYGLDVSKNAALQLKQMKIGGNNGS